MKALSLVQHNLRQKSFHNASTLASVALKKDCNQDQRTYFFLSFWKTVAAALIKSTDIDIVRDLESLMAENPTFDYTIISVLIWIEEYKKENIDPNFLEKLQHFQRSSEKKATVQSIVLAAEFFMYAERFNQATQCLFKIHHQMYQVTEPSEVMNDLFRVSAWLYSMSGGNSQIPSDKFDVVLNRDNNLDLDCALAFGKYYACRDEMEKSKGLLMRAVEYDETYFPAHLELSILLFLNYDFEGAIYYAKKATKCCDGDLACIYHSIAVSLQLGKYEAGRHYLNVIVQEILTYGVSIYSEFSANLCRTVCHISNYDKESIEVCIGLMAHICESDPENTKLRLEFAHLLRCAKRYDQAISLYEFISSLNDNLEALEGLLLTNALQGNIVEAKQQLELYSLLAESKNSHAPLDTILATILVFEDSFDKAIDTISEHFELHFASERVVTNIDISTIVLISKTILFKYRYQLPSNIQKLLQILMHLSKRYINHEMVLVLAKLHLELDDIVNAMETISSFVKNHSSSQSMRKLEVHALLGMGDIKNASANMKKIMDGETIHHDDLYFIALKCWLLFLENRSEEGKLLLKPILFDFHGNIPGISWGDRKRCLLFYGHCSLLNDEELNELLPVVDVEAQNSKCFELVYLRSQLQVRLGFVEKALNVLDSVPVTSLDYTRAQHAKAWLLLNKNQDKHGFLEIFKRFAKEENSLESFVHLGRAHLKIGNQTEALSSYRHAIVLEIEKEDTAIKICNDILDSQANDAVAIDFCKCHLDDFPKHLRIKLLLATILRRIGDYSTSLNVYNDILSTWDDGTFSVLDKIDVQKAAASVYHDTGEIELALELLYEARDLCSILISDIAESDFFHTEMFHLQVNISQILMTENNFTQAMTSLQDALDLGGYNDIKVLKMIAVSSFECKLYDKCDLYCKQVLALDPNDEDCQLFRHRITNSQRSNHESITVG